MLGYILCEKGMIYKGIKYKENGVYTRVDGFIVFLNLESLITNMWDKMDQDSQIVMVEGIPCNHKATKGNSKKGKKYNKMLHSLAYRMFLDKTEQICNRKNVGLIKVNPAWTSWIAQNKFCDKMKLNIHTGASFVIARRGMDIKDAI